ncbi:MAG: methionyl-tRNA formyltransferase [bacterium]
MSLRTVFFGTPEFALPTLQALIDDNEIEVTGVVTQPDRPAGRGNRLRPSPVKELALAHQLDILQPVKLKDPEVVPWLQRQNAHVYVVVAYGGFIPRTIRELTPWGCINLHPSLLPKYRGAAPIQWAIMNGDTHTGTAPCIYPPDGNDGGCDLSGSGACSSG